ncbi:MAG: MFS transporter [Desulfovibrio sp.]|jgi:FSR family fosmidomycin resistance protein-like MFS transporter|nr:MFS transporter [Desulfovibrio sp.]
MKERNSPYIYLLSAGHLFTDMNQGALPAILPFFIAEYGFSYATAASLVFALNLISSVIQPAFGALADKISKPWIMAAGAAAAVCGPVAAGFITDYPLLFAAFMISGIGIAAFHPEAARYANKVSGRKQGTGLSIFSFGGNLGFALGPATAMWLILSFGLKGMSAFLLPAAVIFFALYTAMNRYSRNESAAAASGKIPSDNMQEKDRWGAFTFLCVIVFSRSFIFHGMNTFLPLYWINILKQPEHVAGLTLSLLLGVGAIGTLIGGRSADRFGFHKIIRGGFFFLPPLLCLFIFTDNVLWATLLLIPIGLALYVPFSPLVVMGQKYLPNRIGLASGVTLGLAVSVGGIAAPLLGTIADAHGLHMVMYIVAGVALLPAILSFALPKQKATGA